MKLRSAGWRLFACLLMGASAHAAVTVSSPASGSTVVSPVQFTASATTTCSSGVGSMGIYVNNTLVQSSVQQGNKLNYALSLQPGAYSNIVVQEWDKCGGSSKTTVPITVVNQGVSYGAVTVTAPTANQTVVSPFTLSATDSVCEGEPVSTMAYSLDGSGTLLATTNATSLNAQVTVSTTGQHVLHVKSWGPYNAACDTDVTVNVTTSALSVVPSNALAARNIQTYLNWKSQFDPGTSGNASGVFSIVNSPSMSGSAMKFVTSFTNNGGNLYYDNFDVGAEDNTSRNWFIDQWVYIASPSDDLANVEMDLNQVQPNGDTVIMGFQCDGWNSTWDYTYTDTSSHWTKSAQPCNPRNWSTDTWHHVQIYFSIDDSENVTYHSVWFDDKEYPINATVHSGLALGWANANIMNFQIDGYGAGPGTITTYLDNSTVYHW